MRLVLLLAFVCAAARGQINGMATTDDGSVLYVTTPFHLAGSAGSTGVRVYAYNGSGFRLYADKFPNGYVDTTILRPWVSGDGSVVAYSGTYTVSSLCGLLRECLNSYTQTAIQVGTGAPMLVDGPAAISANGRYVLLPELVLVDLSTGARTTVPRPATSIVLVADSVASDGTVLYADPSLETMYVWRADSGLRRIGVATSSAVMDDGATTVFYTYGIAIYRYDLATGASGILANGDAPSISRDGRWTAFVSPVDGVQQAWAVAADGSRFLQLTNEAAGVSSAVISGNGNVVYVATATNAVWKFDLTAGTSSAIVPVTPAPVYEGGVAGSLSTLWASGLVKETVTAAPPLPASLAGVQVLLNGAPAPLVSVSPTEVVYQIPWETLGLVSIQLKTAEANPVFEAAAGSRFVESFEPEFLTRDCVVDGYPRVCAVAMHMDGSGVTEDHPAAPGEVIRLLATGLGAVSPPVATGAASPVSPPAVVTHSFACQLWQNDGLTEPFALGDMRMLGTELLPGSVGTYGVTAQLPAATGDTATALVYCRGSDYYTPGWLPVAPAGPPFESAR